MHLHLEKPPKMLRLFLPALALIFAAALVFSFISIASANPAEKQKAPLQQAFNLAISKSQLPQPFTVGSNNRYIINVSRTNTDTITQAVIVSDTLPPGITWTPPTTVGNWDCTSSTPQLVSCVYAATIPPNLTAFEAINIVANVSSNIASESVVNRAVLVNGGNDASDDSDVVTTTIRSADLQIDKTRAPLSVTGVGDVVTYTIIVTNAGPTIAESVIVTETQPQYLNDLTAVPSSPDFTWNSNYWRWNIGNMAKNTTRTLVLTATVKDESPTDTANGRQVINEARVSSSTHDWNTANNAASSSFMIGGFNINKSVSDPTQSVLAGQPFTYTIVVTNTSPADIYNVLVSDTISNVLTAVGCSIHYPTRSTETCFVGTNNLLNSMVNIRAYETIRVVVVVRGNEEIASGSPTVKNTASIGWGSPRFTLRSNTVEKLLQPAGQIQVGKTASPASVVPGQPISYTIAITNVGSLATIANTLKVTDTLLSDLDFVSINKNGLTMSEVIQTGNVRSWLLPTKALNPGEKITFFITAKVKSSPSSDQTVNEISAEVRDTINRETRHSAQLAIPISTGAGGEVRISKTVSPDLAQVGEDFTFKIEVRNTGSASVSNVIINDYFPEALDLTGATTSRGAAQLNTTTREVEVRINPLNPDERATIVITARVNSTVKAPHTYRNRAYLDWDFHSGEIESNGVPYRVYPSGTLPGTGGLGIGQTPRNSTGTFLAAAAALLLLAGLILLFSGLIRRIRHPLSGSGGLRLGMLLLFGAALSGAVYLLQPRPAPPPELSLLGGSKPPVASPLPVLPGSTVEPQASPSAAPPQPSIEPEEPSELIPLRPTPEEPPPLPPAATPTLTAGEIDLSHLLPTPTPLTLPDFPIPTPTGTGLVGPDGGEADTSAIVRISIPAMRLVTNVKYVPFGGSTWLISGLKQEVAWMGDTSWPGVGGNTGLAGHVDLVTGARGPFWNLKDLKAGDEVVLQTLKKVYTYRVSRQAVVDDHDLSVIQPTSKPQLTLITCTGWDTSLRVYLKRLVVFAELLSVQPIVSASN